MMEGIRRLGISKITNPKNKPAHENHHHWRRGWRRYGSSTHDKQGTNIVSKNSIADKWPFNNWGDLWVQVCPPWTDEKSGKNHPANEIMYRTMGCGGDIEGHGDMTTDGYSIPAFSSQTLSP